MRSRGVNGRRWFLGWVGHAAGGAGAPHPARQLMSPWTQSAAQVLSNDIDLLNPPAELEKLKHKKKRLVQSPNSFFMDVKCQGCFSM
ncbi:hypothetical protein OsI_15727 [Oryza sativa Indica Group]|uniref:Uncharacterized protein n=1 Tax=Oryza sativa subsp. indica TaxID=39946 RepID=B8ATF7_ORYSI|nr:hypothetical protein OsI_15727 [Oryza sativa Indica Group]